MTGAPLVLNPSTQLLSASTMLSSIRDRLLCAEDDFLTALAQGGDALFAFDERWQQLLKDVDSAVDTSAIDHETTTLAYAIATRCALLADTSASLFATYDTLTSQLVDHLDTMMSDLSITEKPRYPSPHPAVPEEISWGRLSSTKRRRKSEQATPTKRRRVASSAFESSWELPSDSMRPNVSWDVSTTWPLAQSNFSAHRTSERRASSPCPSSHPTPAPSRKRRLSEDDISSIPPRAKRLYAGPRIHAVSDSFPTLLPAHSSIPPLLLTLEPTPLPPDTTMPLEIQSLYPLSTMETRLLDRPMGTVDVQADPIPSLDPMGLDFFLTSSLDVQISREHTLFPASIRSQEDAASSCNSVDSPRSIASDCSPAVTPSPITPPVNTYLDLPLSFTDPGFLFPDDDAFVLPPSERQTDWLSLLPSQFDRLEGTGIPQPSCAVSLSSDTLFLELKGPVYERSPSPLAPNRGGDYALFSRDLCPATSTIT